MRSHKLTDGESGSGSSISTPLPEKGFLGRVYRITGGSIHRSLDVLTADASALPYRAVMATGGASRLAAPSGLASLTLPLLWLAVIEAIAIPLLGLHKLHRADRVARPLIPPSGRFGDFTIPLGLAVIAVGFANVGKPYAYAVAAAITCLAWLSTLFFLVVVVAPVVVHRPELVEIDGAWFLAPAALLGDAIGTTAVLAMLPDSSLVGLSWLALVACGLGFASYWLVVILAATRLLTSGIAARRLAPWWISAGCGGLAADAVGQIERISPISRQRHLYEWAALAVWVAGSILLAPVLIYSIRYLARLQWFSSAPPWPPTFSTAVYALGATAAGVLSQQNLIIRVGQMADVATVVLWMVTAIVYLVVLSRRLSERTISGPPPAAE